MMNPPRRRRPGPARSLAGRGSLLVALVLTGCGGAPSHAGVAPAAPEVPAATVDCGRPGGITVHTEGELTGALTAAAPGSRIELAAGTYAGHFSATAAGDPARPITLCGGRDAVLDGGTGGYTLHLSDSAYWLVSGLTVRGGQKGVVLDNTQHTVIAGLEIADVGEEALHLRTNSSDNLVTGNLIHNTGRQQGRFGEGIYIGSARSNWARYTGGRPDRSDRNQIIGNTVFNTTSEAVDIKEGTTGGTVRNNKFTGPMSDANSWVNVKGNSWQIIGNIGNNSNGDGFSVHQILDGWGLDNAFSDNTAVVNGPGYGINVTRNRDRTVVSCGNRAEGAAKGLSNTPCTR
jgi:hypothetical protein